MEIYGQLPDYDEFQGYDLGVGTDLRRIAGNIYANSHNSSWKAVKHHVIDGGGAEEVIPGAQNSSGAIKGRVQSRKNVWAGRKNPNFEYI